MNKPFAPGKTVKQVDVFLLLLALLAVLTHWVWFVPGSQLYWSDWQRWSDPAVRDLLIGARSTWNALVGLGTPIGQVGFNVFLLPWGIVGSYALGSKLTLFIPTALLSLIAPYLLARELTGDKLSSFMAALFYGFNTYLLAKQGAHVPIAFVVALAPLLLAGVLRFLRNPTQMRAVLLALGFSLAWSYELRIGLLCTLCGLLAVPFFLERERHSWKPWLTFIGLSGLLNLFWILPLISQFGNGPLPGSGSASPFGNWLFDLPHALTLSINSWTAGPPGDDFVLQPVPWHLWFIPLLAFSALLLPASRQTRQGLGYFALLSMLGLLLGKQAAAPLTGLYEWLFEHLPGFALFREASKFYLLIALGYLGLIAHSLHYLNTSWSKKSNR